MYQIIVVPTGNKANAVLFFKEKNSADDVHKVLLNAQKGISLQVVDITDDFGVRLTIDKEIICCVMLMDSEKQIELAKIMGGKNG